MVPWFAFFSEPSVRTRWLTLGIGIPMNDTNNPRLEIAEVAEAILGDHLVGFQLGNEPDLYAQYVPIFFLIYKNGVH